MMHNIWQGRRVRLRGLRVEDAEALAAAPLDTEAEALADAIHPPVAHTVERERDYINREIARTESSESDDCKLAIETLDEDRFVGTIGLHATNRRFRTAQIDIYILLAGDRGKGYGGESILLLLNYAFNELNYQRAGLDVYEPNVPAIGLYRKLGFVEEGRVRRGIFYKGEYHAEFVMGMLREEFTMLHHDFSAFLYSNR